MSHSTCSSSTECTTTTHRLLASGKLSLTLLNDHDNIFSVPGFIVPPSMIEYCQSNLCIAVQLIHVYTCMSKCVCVYINCMCVCICIKYPCISMYVLVMITCIYNLNTMEFYRNFFQACNVHVCCICNIIT